MTQGPPEIRGLVFVTLLGSGGYSDVYLYQQQLPRRQVAVKVLKDASGMAETRARALTAEANAMAGLADHPNIVPVFSADITHDGRPYIVMMYYPRPNLGQRAARERLGIAEVLRIGIQIASAIETAHRAGILHRDIKPANILTSQYGAPGLTDFGIAAQIAEEEDDEQAGVSVPWSPPEVLYSSGPPDVRSDVYSLAATLWHLLVGRSPFEDVGGDNSPLALMRRVRDMPPPPTGRPDVPDLLERLLRQAMAKDPAARPASALDFARGLQAVEQAVHLQRTEVVVLTDREPDDGPDDRGGGDATRLRTPKAITAQPVIETTPPAIEHTPPPPAVPLTIGAQPAMPPGYRPAAPGAYPGPAYGTPPPGHPAGYPSGVTGTRTGAPTGTTGATGTTGGGVAGITAAPPAPVRRRAPYLIASVVVLAAVIVGIVALTRGGGDHKPDNRGSISQSPVDQDPGVQQGAPGAPEFSAQRAGTVVSFAWVYSSSRSDDSFLVRVDQGRGYGAATATASPSFTVHAKKGVRVCIEIKIRREDGSSPQIDWSQPGCST